MIVEPVESHAHPPPALALDTQRQGIPRFPARGFSLEHDSASRAVLRPI
jgi:hypothetical protein